MSSCVAQSRRAHAIQFRVLTRTVTVTAEYSVDSDWAESTIRPLSHSFRLFMSTFDLNCWILNEDYTSVFPIEIGCTKTVGNLKNAIKQDQRVAFQHVDPRNLDLWIVSVFIDTSLKQNVDKLGLQNEPLLLPGTKLSKIFSDEPKDEHVHIVVQPPPTCTCEWLICYITDFSSDMPKSVLGSARSPRAQLFRTWRFCQQYVSCQNFKNRVRWQPQGSNQD